MAELKKTIKVRAGNRAFARKVINQTQDLLKNEINDEILGKISSNHKVLVEKLDLLKKLDSEILELMAETDDLKSEVVESSDFAACVTECLEKIAQVLHISSKEENKPTEGESTSSQQSKMAKAKLPKLLLNKFTGNPVEWQPFWDSFQSSVGSNPDLSDVDKFNYLKSLVQGPAAGTISGFSLTSENYQEAVKLLSQRYGNKQIIISAHMDSLLKLSSVQSMNDIKKLRELYDKIEASIRSLNNLGTSPSTYGSFLTPMIMTKIPEELRVILSRNLGSDEWTLESMMKLFLQELEHREKCVFVTGSSVKKDTPTRNIIKRNTEKPYTASTLMTEEKTEASGPWCTYCSGQHKSVRCNIVTDVTARKQTLRKKGKCFRCLRGGHLVRDCKSSSTCSKCGGKHHVSICAPTNEAGSAQVSGGSQENKSNASPSSSTNLHVGIRNDVLLQTAQAIVINVDRDQQCIKTRLVFDSCSQRTYISEKLVKALGLTAIGSDTLLIKTFGETTARLRKCELVHFAIQSRDHTETQVTAHVVPTICGPISNQNIDFARQHYSHLQHLDLADSLDNSVDGEIDILIGADYYWLFVNEEVIRGSCPGPVAVSTKLGYVLSGPVARESVTDDSSTVNLSETHVLRIDTMIKEEEISLNQEIKRFWDLDTLGIKKDESPVYDKFLEKISFNGERYEVELPFKEHCPLLPDNYSLSKVRLESLLRRLKSRPDVLQQYDEVIKEQEKNNVVETCSNVTEVGNVHYLPYREVIRLDKQTTKLRVVYDGSAKKDGPSLNDCLYSGPSLSPLLFDIMLRFRMKKVALIADLEKAFLSISIVPHQRDFLRFLWIDDINKENPQIVVKRFTRVVFGVTSSPFLLNGTVRHHLKTYKGKDPDIVKQTVRSMYVDDLALSVDDDDVGYSTYLKLKETFNQGGFNIRKWKTNSEQLQTLIDSSEKQNEKVNTAAIQEEDQSFLKSEFDKQVQATDNQKVLGTEWNNVSDKLNFNFDNLTKYLEEPVVTKRVILGSIAKIFDPLGILSPLFIAMKVLFQTVCKMNVDWDAPLNDDVTNQWKLLLHDMKCTTQISIDRCYLPELNPENILFIELHGFGDASQHAYAGVVYIRVVMKDSVHCALVASNTRVAPMKQQTIPRLELLAALLLAKLMTKVQNALKEVVEINS